MKRILLVDDNAANLYMLRALLQGHGYQVDEARDGGAALAAASRVRPDLVVSDLLMPVMDGFALLRRWKADESLKTVPFAVYTATYTDPRDERLALSLGADAFILKPAEPEPLLARLELLLAKAERGEMPAAAPPPGADDDLLEAQTETLSRKLEKKAQELQQANAEVLDGMVDRRRAEDALRESEQRFRELAETVQEVFWMSDPGKTKVLYVSPAYERLWGRSCASLYQSPDSWVEAILPEDRERIRRASLTRQASGEYDETFRIRRTDGTVRWIRDRAYPVRDADGKVVRLVGTAEDITERRHLEDQFRQSQKMEAIGQLAAGVAHDFNNIIAVILGFAELAQAQLSKGRAAGDSLEEITKASVRAKSLVQQILTFSRQQPQERKIMPMGPTVARNRELPAGRDSQGYRHRPGNGSARARGAGRSHPGASGHRQPMHQRLACYGRTGRTHLGQTRIRGAGFGGRWTLGGDAAGTGRADNRRGYGKGHRSPPSWIGSSILSSPPRNRARARVWAFPWCRESCRAMTAPSPYPANREWEPRSRPTFPRPQRPNRRPFRKPCPEPDSAFCISMMKNPWWRWRCFSWAPRLRGHRLHPGRGGARGVPCGSLPVRSRYYRHEHARFIRTAIRGRTPQAEAGSAYRHLFRPRDGRP